MELARKVQQSMLPTTPPHVEGYHFFDFYRSAYEVGGDYYDYIELPDGRVAVVVADVSGKGIPAALFMARLSSDVRYCLASEATPAAAVRRLNAGLTRQGWQDSFVTLVLVLLDPARPHGHDRQRRATSRRCCGTAMRRSAIWRTKSRVCRWGSSRIIPTNSTRMSSRRATFSRSIPTASARR